MRIRTLCRLFAIALLAMWGAVSASAADYVTVTDKEGKATTFALTDKPMVTFTSDQLVLTAGSKTVEYPLTDFLSFTFTDQPTGINTVGADQSNAVFSFTNFSVRGEGLKAGTRVSVYTINGQLVGSAVVNQNGAVEVPFDGQKGVFIVKSLTKTFKFINQ